MRDNIILIGFMGCGKTSIGIRLSYRLRRTFLDTDRWIERKQKKSIRDIFATEGEAAFRQMETECLQELAKETGRQIFSTGGGLPIKEENRPLLKKLGTVVYLQASPEVIYERLKEDTTRPLLQTENPKERIRELMDSRSACYEAAADVILDVDEKSPEEVVEAIASIAERKQG